jgi:hypothetical protein
MCALATLDSLAVLQRSGRFALKGHRDIRAEWWPDGSSPLPYVWLIHRESPTKVGTYAYVNPVVAVLLGYFVGGEGLGLRTILGTLLVLTSVLLITTTRASQPAT